MYNIKKESNRFIIENESLIGKIEFEYFEDSIAVTSTYVNPEYRGQNIARMLVDEVVMKARKENKQIIPVCSYVLRLFEKNAEFNDVWNKKQYDFDQVCKL